MNREPFCLQNAWQNIGALYATIVALFGAPFEIATQFLLMQKNRRDILSWLGPVEALARRLLLLKALTMPMANDPPSKAMPGRLNIAFADKAVADIHPESEQWRGRFNVMPMGVSRQTPCLAPCAYRRGSNIEFNALPLARRLEALRRVLENPAPALARLCRLIASRRGAVSAAFRPYRPPAHAVQDALSDAQHEIDIALNTS